MKHLISTPPVVAPDPVPVLRRNVLILAWANAVTGAGFIVADPGAAASLAFLRLAAPLPVWGGVFLVVAALLVGGYFTAGHTVAVPLWLMWGVGAVIGVAAGTTPSPAGSIALSGIVTAMAGFHINGMVFRRRQLRARRGRH